MSEDLSNVIDRVRKLLSLAEGNKNENEVKAATAAADRIMQRFRISVAMLEAAGKVKTEPMIKRNVCEGGRRSAWRETLLWALCNHYGCSWYFFSKRSSATQLNVSGDLQGRKGSKGRTIYTVVGRTSDVEILSYMYSYLQGEVERLSKQNSGMGIKWALAYMGGVAEGINAQLIAARRTMKAESVAENTCSAMVLLDKRCEEALAVVNKECADEDGKVKVGRACAGAWDYDARRAGMEDGKKLQIKQGLPAGREVMKLV
jgi:hypothetical protein